MQTWKPERLTEARQSRGLTKAELAKALGVSKSTVTQWEKGLTAPRGSHLTLLAQVLGKPERWFYGQEEVAASPSAPPPGPDFEEWARQARERLEDLIREMRQDWERRRRSPRARDGGEGGMGQGG